MRPLGVVLGVVIGISFLSGTIWLAGYSPMAEKPTHVEARWEKGTGEKQKALIEQEEAEHARAVAKAAEEDKKELKRLEEKKPPIADKPPYPKVRTGERVYEFGSMGVNEEKSHKFHIENKGQAPLLIAKGPTNCKCTISNISKNTVAPGGSAEIEMSWTPKETTRLFAKTATVWTNDPELPEIQFKIFGKVVKEFILVPERNWHAGQVTDVQDGVTYGTLSSEMDTEFKILSVDTGNPNVEVEYRPLNSREKMREGYKSGYQFTVTVDKKIPAGNYRGQLKIHTSLEGNKTIDVDVTAVRSGPILFLPPIGSTRSSWNSEKSLLNLGRFPHDAGSKVILPALIYGYGSKEKFQVLGVEKDADFVKVTTEPNSEIGGPQQQGVRFIFEVVPVAPAVTRMTPNGVHVTIKTNHPRLKELKFEVTFVSQ